MKMFFVHSEGFLFTSTFAEEVPIGGHPKFSPLLVGFFEWLGIPTYSSVGYLFHGVRVGPSARLMLPAARGYGFKLPSGVVICRGCLWETEWIDCYNCGGEGYFDGYEEDPLWYDQGDLVPCGGCDGDGGQHYCENPDCESGIIWSVTSKYVYWNEGQLEAV